MTKTHDRQELLEAYRAGLEPTPAEVGAVWSTVSAPDARPRVRRARRPQEPRSVPYVGMATAGVAVAAAIAVWWIGLTSNPAAMTPSETPSQAAFQDGSGAPEQQASRSLRPRVRPSPAVAPSEPEPPPPESQAPPSPKESVMPSPPRRTPAGPASPPDSPAPAGSLADEAELLRRAERRLREGDAKAALKVLETCGRRFPGGELIVERRALRVIALCRNGKGAQGRGEAAVVRADAASRPYRERIRRACEIE